MHKLILDDGILSIFCGNAILLIKLLLTENGYIEIYQMHNATKILIQFILLVAECAVVRVNQHRTEKSVRMP